MENSWLICVGNPFDGLMLYGGDDGLPFQDHEEAVEKAESRFRDEPWLIVGVHSTSDLVDLAGDAEEEDEGGEGGE